MFGLAFAAKNIRRYVCKVISETHGDENTGTGFFVDLNDKYVVTCRHNLYREDGQPRTVLEVTNEGNVIPVTECLKFWNVDLALLTIPGECNLPYLLHDNSEILDEILTAGFPNVALRVENPLLIHRGEIAGKIHEHDGPDERVIISARVAPGTSGGPVLSKNGGYCGIVDQQIEVKTDYYTTQHQSTIPSNVLVNEFISGNYTKEELRQVKR